nr:uncharacterized protein LOC121502489 [Drosophila kikkawai]
MRESIEKVLGDTASVRATTEDSKVLVLEVRNIDPIATKQDVCAALAGQFNFEAERVNVRSMRRSFAETQTAIISLPVSLAKAVLHRGEVRIGWTICRIRERLGPVRCFRCLEPGHIAIHCKGPVDRSGCCINCGEPGHKAASCNKEPSCFICSAAGRKETRHKAGARGCPASNSGAAQDLLSQTVRELNSKVAVLSEPYRVGTSRVWATDRSGKAALWLCGADAPEMCDTKAAEGFVRANVGGTWLYSCYLAPSPSLEAFGRIQDELSSDLRGRSNVVVGGDINAWAMEWGSSRTNARGRAVLETFASLDVVLLNEGSRQTFSRAGVGSVIDLTYVSSALASRARWKISEAYTASDHEAIECSIGAAHRTSGSLLPDRKAFRQDTFRPRDFANALEGFTAGEAEGANETADKLAWAVDGACSQSMLLRRPFRKHHSPVFWWSEEIADLRRKCHRSRRLLQRARGTPRLLTCNDRYKAARKELKTAIKNSKRECFLKLCDAAEEDPWGGAYRMVVKRLNAGGCAPTDPATLERIVGPLFPSGRQVLICPSTELGDNRWVTEAEVLLAGRSLKPKKAPGPDAIPSRATKLTLSLLTSEVVGLFNKCLLEAIEAAGGLSPEQYGFTKGKSTLDAIAKVVKLAQDAIAGTRWKGGSKSYCLVVTLDIRNAFNPADWSRTLESLRNFNIPGYLLNVAHSYFSHRVLMMDTSMGPKEHNV